MKKNILYAILFGLFALIQQLFGQISEGGTPYTFSNTLKTQISTYDLITTLSDFEPTVYIDTLEGDTITHYDPVIGEIFPINVNPITQGTYDVLENNDTICRFQINSNTGTYMMLLFDDFYLPQGSSLYIYSSDKTQLIGSFTSRNNTPQNKFTTSPLKCNSLVLEYYKPSHILEKERLNIKSIGLIANNLSGIISKDFGNSGDCMINAKCPQYENWCDQRRSVALIIRVLEDGRELRWCSGSLVTNERRDGKPFLLTAFHCIDNNPENYFIDQSEKDELQRWLFVFNYQSEDCDDPVIEPSLAYSVVGATYVRSSYASDYAILQLSHKPPESYNVYYNGWSNDSDDMTNTGVCIHHPAVDIKKISEWEKKIPEYNYWKVKWTVGSTQAGSSGSPLFNDEGYLVGQNSYSNGRPVCKDAKRDFFGRFDRSWHNNGLNEVLNPNEIHSSQYVVRMTGDETCKNDWYFASGDDLHTSDNVSFMNYSSVGTRQYDGVYNAKNSIVAESVTIQANTSVIFEAANEIVLKPGFHAKAGSSFVAKIGDCKKGCGNGHKMTGSNGFNSLESNMVIIEKQANIEDLNFEYETKTSDVSYSDDDEITIYPNPNDGNFKISISINPEEINKIQIFNVMGELILEKSAIIGNEINIPNPTPGFYFLSIALKNKVITQKIIIQ